MLCWGNGDSAKCVELRDLQAERAERTGKLHNASRTRCRTADRNQQGIFEGNDVTLCAVRLKIIDLAGGDQPIVSDDRDIAIVFNGEIYNHLEVRRELESLGHR